MKFATIREAAESLNISEARLRRAVKSGEIPFMMLGMRTVVDIDTVATLLARPEGVNITTVSNETGLSVSAIRRAVREGWIPCDKTGKAFLFNMEEVRAAIEARMKSQTKPR